MFDREIHRYKVHMSGAKGSSGVVDFNCYWDGSKPWVHPMVAQSAAAKAWADSHGDYGQREEFTATSVEYLNGSVEPEPVAA